MTEGVNRCVKRGQVLLTDPSQLRQLISGFERVLIDVGTGDGLYPYREAKKDSGLLCIGIDPVEKTLIKVSGRIGRKPSRGGVNNLVLMVASVDTLPQVLNRSATRLTVLFPWGSLLAGLSLPEQDTLARLRALLKTGGDFEVLLNMQVFEDTAYRGRKGLPSLDSADHLKPAWAAAGFEINHWEFLAPGSLPAQTTWGQKLTLGSGRNTMHINARAIAQPEGA